MTNWKQILEADDEKRINKWFKDYDDRVICTFVGCENKRRLLAAIEVIEKSCWCNNLGPMQICHGCNFLQQLTEELKVGE